MSNINFPLAGIFFNYISHPIIFFLYSIKEARCTQLNFSIGVVTSVGLTRRSRQNEALKMWGILIAQALPVVLNMV